MRATIHSWSRGAQKVVLVACAITFVSFGLVGYLFYDRTVRGNEQRHAVILLTDAICRQAKVFETAARASAKTAEQQSAIDSFFRDFNKPVDAARERLSQPPCEQAKP